MDKKLYYYGIRRILKEPEKEKYTMVFSKCVYLTATEKGAKDLIKQLKKEPNTLTVQIMFRRDVWSN